MSQMITRTNISLFNIESFNQLYEYNINWTVEPYESLKELYKQHAQYIRDSYEYIVLYFSGGSDSTTMLNAFLDNNIYVDEIVTVIYDKIDLPCFDGIYASNYLKLKEYKGKYTQIKIPFSVIKSAIISDNFIDMWSQNFTGALHGFSRMNIHQYEKFGIISSIPRKENIAHVFGIDDPTVIKKENNFYICHSIKQQVLFNGNIYHNTIKFFTNKDFPKPYVKQAHILAKIMKKLDVDILPKDMINKLIRDGHNSLISPPKSNVMSIILQQNSFTEANILFKLYSKKESTFSDTYINSVLKEQISIENTFLNIMHKTKKFDLLF